MQIENRMRGRAVVAHWAHNPKVVGSNPAPATFFFNMVQQGEDNNCGLVVCSTGSSYVVRRDDGERFDCIVKGKFRTLNIKTTNPVAVGDRVHFISSKNSEYFLIDKIFPRKNYIIRRSVNLSKLYSIIASNVDMAFLIVSCKNPQTDTMFIDRFLVTANAYNVPTTIVINKTDLLTDDASQEYAGLLIDIYKNIGYPVLLCSVNNLTGIKTLKAMLSNKISLFAGNSGVGKSSLINLLCPNAHQKTDDISSSHHSGKHTTTFASMIEYEDIHIIDTPGVKSFGIVDFKKEELALYFPEMKQRLSDCKFYNCTHTHEPSCAIKQAVEQGIISAQRYNNYLKLLAADDMN